MVHREANAWLVCAAHRQRIASHIFQVLLGVFGEGHEGEGLSSRKRAAYGVSKNLLQRGQANADS